MDNNTTGGAISFEMLVETGQLDRASEESIKRIKGISRESVAAGKAVDEFFGATTDNVKIQKDVISELEKRYSSLQKEIDRLAPGRAQAELRKEAIIVRAELDAEKNTLNELEASVKKNSVAHASFRTQLRYAKDALVEMEMAGKRGTEEYRIKQQELARLTDAMNDAQAQANILAHDQGGFQGVISAISGVAGGFSAAQGAMGLFAGENENLQKIMLKVQSLMAISIGLQQIQQTLNKDSAFMLKTVATAKDFYASATNRLSVALGLSNVAAKALMATLTLGLSVAIGGAIYLTERYISKQKELTKRQEEFTSKVADEAYKTLSAVETLSAKYKSLGDNMKAKEKFVQDNVKAFDDLGVSIRNVSDAENILNENKKKFIEAQIEKAKALAATQIAAEKFKELIQTELKIQETPKTILTGTQRGFGPQPQSQQEIKNPALVKLESEKKGIEGEIKSLYELSDKADSIANEIIKGLGVTGDETLGIIEKLKKELSDLESKKEKSKSGSEILTLNKEIEAKRSELSKYELKESRTSSKDPLVEQLEKKKKLYQDYFNWINSNRPDLTEGAKKEFEDLLKGGNSFMDYLEKQAMELEGKRGITDDQKKQLKAIRDYIANEVKTTALDTFEKELTVKLEAAKTTLEKMSILDQSKPGGTTELDKAKQDFINSEKEKTIREERALTQELLANYAGYLQEKIQFNESYAENKRLLNLAFEKAENDDAKKIALEALTELERQKEQFNNKSGNKDYDELIDRYKSFKQQLDDLVADFDRQIELALKNGNKDLADTISNAKEDELKRFVKGFSKTEVTGYIEELKRALSINLAIFASTGQQSDKLFEIKKLIEDINGLLEVLPESSNNIVRALDYAINSLNELSKLAGEDLDERSRKLIDTLSSSIDGVARIISGDIFGGVSQIVFSIADSLDKQFGRQKRIYEIEREREAYNNRIAFSYESITRELNKQIKLLENLPKIDAIVPSIDAYRSAIERAANELEALKLDLAIAPKGVRVQLDVEHLKKIFKTDDIAEALRAALSEGLISEEQYNLALDYLSTIEESTDRIRQLQKENRDYILGSVDTLAGAIEDMFLQGEYSAKSLAQTFEKVMRQAIVRGIAMKGVEKELEGWMNRLYSGLLGGGMSSESWLAEMEASLQAIMTMNEGAYEIANQMLDNLYGATDDTNSLSGAIKGVTEQTAGLIAGQMNAIRMNQAQALMLMDDQLAHLSEIASNTRYNKLLVDIKNLLQSSSNNSTNSNRAAGGN